MLRTHAGWLVQVGAFCACACGATNGSALDASSMDAGSTGATGSSTEGGGDPEAATCADLSSAAKTAIGKAIASASASVGCASDSDCALGPNGSDCSSACSGPITTTAGAAAIQSTIDEVNRTTCATFKGDGCPPPVVFPCASGPLGIACVHGTCTDFPPAAWASFAFDQQPGASGFSTPPSCNAGNTCSLWTVTPDAHVAVIDPQGTHAATLSTSDFATVDGIMRSMSLRQSEMTGFMCGSSPGGQVISFDESREGGLTGQDVTGCVLTGPSGNGVQALFDVVKAY
jgi:hypothetical protein